MAGDPRTPPATGYDEADPQGDWAGSREVTTPEYGQLYTPMAMYITGADNGVITAGDWNTIPISLPMFAYMESGFLDLGSWSVCAEATYHPATLHEDGAMLSYLNSTPTPLQGEAYLDGTSPPYSGTDSPFAGTPIPDGNASAAVGGHRLYNSVTDYCGNTYSSGLAVYSSYDVRMQKLCQRFIPSGKYSGKLRLFIQSLYGSGRTDYDMQLSEFGTPESSSYTLRLDGFTLSHSGNETTGLFTSPDYNYYIVSVSATVVTFYPLILTDTGKAFRDILKDHPNRTGKFFASRVEAYIFSGALIDTDNPIIVSLGALPAGVEIGQPFAYGWQFNWGGNECKAICHRITDEINEIYGSRTLTLALGETGGVPTASRSISAETPWQSTAFFRTLHPDYFDYSIQTQKSMGETWTNSSATPIYGYYDADNVWREFIYKCNLSLEPPFSRNDGDITPGDIGGTYGQDPIGYSWYVITQTGTYPKGTIGFEFGDQSVTIDVHNYDGYKSYTNSIVAQPPGELLYFGLDELTSPDDGLLTRDGYVFPYLHSINPYIPNTPQWGWKSIPTGWQISADIQYPWMSDWYAGKKSSEANIAYDYYSRDNYWSTGTITVGVPLDDCQTIVFAWQKVASWSSGQEGEYFSESLIKNPYYMVRHMTGESPVRSTVQLGVSYLDVAHELIHNGAHNAGLKNITNITAGGSTETHVRLGYSGYGDYLSESADGKIIKEEYTATDDAPAWAAKWVIPGNLIGTPNMIARQSAGGSHILNCDDAPGGYVVNGFPALSWSAVGWV